MGSSQADIHRVCPGARVGRGLAIHGAGVDRARFDLENWIREREV